MTDSCLVSKFDDLFLEKMVDSRKRRLSVISVPPDNLNGSCLKLGLLIIVMGYVTDSAYVDFSLFSFY